MTRVAALVALALLPACSGGGGPMPDGGVDGAHDAGPPEMSVPIDHGVDAHDAGAPRDLGDLGCVVGRGCTSDSDCGDGGVCQGMIDGSVPIIVDGGPDAAPFVYYPGGYCTNAAITGAIGLGTCDPNADPTMPGADGCPTCARCIDLGPSSSAAGAPHLTQCAERCTPNVTDNDVCRDGYMCAPDTATCTFAECMTDLDCQLYVEDTNGDGICNAGTGDETHVDPLGGTCSTSTYRCERAGSPTAHAGDHCTLDSQCEANGRCLAQCQFSDFTGGYCTKNFCNLTGNECAAGEKCFDGGGAAPGFWMCVRPCTVDAEDPSLVLGAGGHGDTCDPGFACQYDNADAVGATGNGGCLPGNYDAVTTNNVGHACTMNDECYSPHGAGSCIFASPSSACAILGCAGYPDTENICGAGNACFSGFMDGSSVCLPVCASDVDCTAIGAPPSHRCLSLSPGDPHRYCWPSPPPPP